MRLTGNLVDETQVLENEARQQQLLPHLQTLVANYKILKFIENNIYLCNVSLAIGKVLFTQKGNAQSAKTYFEQGLKVCENIFGPDHVQVPVS